MDANLSDLDYAQTQASEARRRLDSVIDRVEKQFEIKTTAVVDTRKDELVTGENMEEIPEEHREFVHISQGEGTELDVEPHIQNIIIDCQMSIELSVKSMFKAVGQEFDYSHGISFDSHNTQEFNRAVPKDYSRREEIIRAIFLTQLWKKFYQVAKYGAPALDSGPENIFDVNDGERAITDAEFCVNLAEDFIQYMNEE